MHGFGPYGWLTDAESTTHVFSAKRDNDYMREMQSREVMLRLKGTSSDTVGNSKTVVADSRHG
jgi:hypothetical protein